MARIEVKCQHMSLNLVYRHLISSGLFGLYDFQWNHVSTCLALSVTSTAEKAFVKSFNLGNFYQFCLQVQNDTIYMGAFEANPVFVDIDPELVYGLYDFEWDVYMPYLNEHMKLMPKLGEVGQKTIICGPESFTPDSQPIFGAESQVSNIQSREIVPRSTLTFVFCMLMNSRCKYLLSCAQLCYVC